MKETPVSWSEAGVAVNVYRVKYDNISAEKRFTFLDLVDLSWRRKLYNTYACKGKGNYHFPQCKNT